MMKYRVSVFKFEKSVVPVRKLLNPPESITNGATKWINAPLFGKRRVKAEGRLLKNDSEVRVGDGGVL
jgi:hypothetical protein